MSPLISTSSPPKVVQTITSEGQLPVRVWKALLEQLGQAQAENKQMKQFVKNMFQLTKETLNHKTFAQN